MHFKTQSGCKFIIVVYRSSNPLILLKFKTINNYNPKLLLSGDIKPKTHYLSEVQLVVFNLKAGLCKNHFR